MSDIDRELQSRVAGFVDELSALIHRRALLAVKELLEKGSTMGAPPPNPPGRKLGEKRTPQELAQITAQVLRYITSNAGQSVEQMAGSLSLSTRELTLPIRKLLAEKKIGSKGQKRATRYFPR
jgi:hypothetical protein